MKKKYLLTIAILLFSSGINAQRSLEYYAGYTEIAGHFEVLGKHYAERELQLEYASQEGYLYSDEVHVVTIYTLRAVQGYKAINANQNIEVYVLGGEYTDAEGQRYRIEHSDFYELDIGEQVVVMLMQDRLNAINVSVARKATVFNIDTSSSGETLLKSKSGLPIFKTDAQVESYYSGEPSAAAPDVRVSDLLEVIAHANP